MNILTQRRFMIDAGSGRAFAQWLSDNESLIHETCPPGVTYLGTFADVFAPDDHSDTYRTLWGMESYETLDAYTDAVKAGGPFAELMHQLGQFVSESTSGAVFTRQLSRRVTDAASWGND